MCIRDRYGTITVAQSAAIARFVAKKNKLYCAEDDIEDFAVSEQLVEFLNDVLSGLSKVKYPSASSPLKDDDEARWKALQEEIIPAMLGNLQKMLGDKAGFTKKRSYGEYATWLAISFCLDTAPQSLDAADLAPLKKWYEAISKDEGIIRYTSLPAAKIYFKK
eukprot:TRINITY_DN10341_c0_g1_i2.p1 TRINITY_DN10341_c0_g1~~TRINITY_DN10341_c0_g1_i2.p1  ORF type:complete len:163 (+),score=30.28 TRINITY_DN10341_c0_g1_i2:41-529(+)